MALLPPFQQMEQMLTDHPVDVSFASRLTGWNAIKSRVEQLGLTMADDEVKLLYVHFRPPVPVLPDIC